MTDKPSTPIERLRARVDQLRLEHREVRNTKYMPGPALCATCCNHVGLSLGHPCHTLKLAEDLLALAEALQEITGCGGGYDGMTARKVARKALAKVGGSDAED